MQCWRNTCWTTPERMTNSQLYLMWACGLESHIGPDAWKRACMVEWNRRGNPEE